MAKENAKNTGNIILVVAALLLLGGIVAYAWNKTGTTKKENTTTGDSIDSTNATVSTNTEAGKMGPNEVQITAANFDQEVVKSNKLTLVDAYAPWCPHCQKIAPIITELSDEYAGKIKVGKMNSDNQNPDVKANFDFAVSNGLTGYPTVWLYKDGQKVATLSGERTKEEYKTEIEKYLK